jgi:uncharacterized protein YciW
MVALCRWSLVLTIRPPAMSRRVEPGLADRDVVDADQLAAYCNYVNRVADGLGVEFEVDWPAETRRPRTYAIRTKD